MSENKTSPLAFPFREGSSWDCWAPAVHLTTHPGKTRADITTLTSKRPTAMGGKQHSLRHPQPSCAGEQGGGAEVLCDTYRLCYLGVQHPCDLLSTAPLQFMQSLDYQQDEDDKNKQEK